MVADFVRQIARDQGDLAKRYVEHIQDPELRKQVAESLPAR